MNSFFKLLQEDHEKVKRLLKRIEKTERPREREQGLEKLKNLLVPHSRAEEQMFYPRMQGEEYEATVLGLEGAEEHRLVDILLEELENTDPDTPLWEARFSVLKENIQHHIKEEESTIFDKFEEVCEDEDFEAMCDEFEDLKAQMMDDLPTQEQLGTTAESMASEHSLH